jgi:predicted transcriptional regulator
MTDDEIKADLMNRLLRKDCWGAKYLPVDTLLNWLAGKVKRDGKRVRTLIRELVNQGCLLLHKGGRTVSLNPALSKEIVEYVERVIDKR